MERFRCPIGNATYLGPLAVMVQLSLPLIALQKLKLHADREALGRANAYLTRSGRDLPFHVSLQCLFVVTNSVLSSASNALHKCEVAGPDERMFLVPLLEFLALLK